MSSGPSTDANTDPSTGRELAADALGEAAARLLRAVDGLNGDDWTGPSLLPGWSRQQLVAHLALNAEALTRLLRGVVADDPGAPSPTMYDSDEQRSSDISELGEADPSVIRERLMGATTTLADAIGAMPDDRWDTRVERTPGGRVMRAGSVPGMRWRELEIHHADLGLDYSRSDWSPAFADHLLGAMVKRLDPSEAFELRPTDSDRVWPVGTAEASSAPAVVTGPAADLGWWLTGRPVPDTLSSSSDELPPIEGW